MPAKSKSRSAKHDNSLSFTNALWTILEDSSFWTISQDDSGGYVVSTHGVVTSMATSTSNFRCPKTGEHPLCMLVFDIRGIGNGGSTENNSVRVKPSGAEPIVSWTTAGQSCHAVIHELKSASEKGGSLAKCKGIAIAPHLPM